MSSEIGVLNLFESSVEPRLVDGIIASDSEAENEVVHLANGKFENEDHLYDNLAFSLHKRATVSNKPDELMRNVADEESSHEKSAPDPDPRVDLLENKSAAAVSDDFIKPISVIKRRRVPIQEKREDTPLTYCTIVCQDWLNEFNISPEDLESSSVNVNDNFNEVRLDNFLRSKTPAYSFFHQNGDYDPMDVDSEDDFDQYDDEDDPFEEEIHRSSRSYRGLIDDDNSADDNSYVDGHDRQLATSKMSRGLSNGDSKNSRIHFDEENVFDNLEQSTPYISAKKKEIRMKRSNLIKSLMKQAKLNKYHPKEELSTFSFETPPSTPSDNDGLWTVAPTVEAFRPQGSGVGPYNRLKLGKDPGPPGTVTCLNCSDFKPSATLNNLAKHIEKVHCPTMLFCLLCKSDEKGCCPSFENVNTAFVHAMENHNTGDEHYFICDFCQVLFSGSQHLQAHYQAHHPREGLPPSALKMQRRFPCLLCLFPFKNSGHRVDHFKNNHRMDISVCFVRNDKKKTDSDSFRSSDESRWSKNGIAKAPVSNVLMEAKLQMRALAREERKLKKMARTENKLMKIVRKEEKQQKRLAKIEEEDADNGASVIAEENEDSNASSILSNGVKRSVLRPELKDRYSDILKNQPRVVLLDVCDEYLKGHLESRTTKLFKRSIKYPQVMLDQKSKIVGNQSRQKVIPDPIPDPSLKVVLDPNVKAVHEPTLKSICKPILLRAVAAPSSNAGINPKFELIQDS